MTPEKTGKEARHLIAVRLQPVPTVSPKETQDVKTGNWPQTAAAKSRQSCPTLCDPIDSSPTGSPVPGILQARVLEWDAIAFSARQLRCMHMKAMISVSPDSYIFPNTENH